MRAAVLGRRVTICRVEVTLVSYTLEIRFQLELLRRRPVDTVCVECVSEIDDATRRKRARSLRHDRNEKKNEEQEQMQTLHVECSLGLGFCYLQGNQKT